MIIVSIISVIIIIRWRYVAPQHTQKIIIILCRETTSVVIFHGIYRIFLINHTTIHMEFSCLGKYCWCITNIVDVSHPRRVKYFSGEAKGPSMGHIIAADQYLLSVWPQTDKNTTIHTNTNTNIHTNTNINAEKKCSCEAKAPLWSEHIIAADFHVTPHKNKNTNIF